TVSFRGRPVAFPDDLHRGIGWVRRRGPRTEELHDVADFVSMPLIGTEPRQKARRRALAALGRIGVADCAGARWHELSDGQRTPVAIAHALVREPKLLVIDDPTASLNVLQSEETMRFLRIVTDEDQIGVLVAMPEMPTSHVDRLGMLSATRLVFPPPTEHTDNVLDFPDRQQSA
ncbi:MAG TPA: ATP-binding cassette domain-containing protein, partial [Solirubrobacteraceae bacterium]|nr:ATP-binding cassette domain-containing protein [Solirubrobacteraceae bacterium]